MNATKYRKVEATWLQAQIKRSKHSVCHLSLLCLAILALEKPATANTTKSEIMTPSLLGLTMNLKHLAVGSTGKPSNPQILQP